MLRGAKVFEGSHLDAFCNRPCSVTLNSNFAILKT